MCQFALVFDAQERYDDAKVLLTNVVVNGKIWRDYDPIFTLFSERKLGEIYFKVRDYKKSEELLEVVLSNMKEILGTENKEILETMNILARVYKARKKYEEAEQLLKEVIERKDEISGENTLNSKEDMELLAEVYSRQKRYDDANKLFEEPEQRMKKKNHQ